MTIAAAYLTSEGVVLGADSTTTVNVRSEDGPAGVAQLFRHAQKVFEVGRDSRLGLCTWGSGTVAGVSHRTIVAQLADRLGSKAETTVGDASEALVEVVQEAVAAEAGDPGDVGYFLGGWNPSGHEPQCYQLSLPARGEPEVRAIELGRAVFSGAPKFFTRVFRGFDAELPGRLLDALRTCLRPVPEDLDDSFKRAFGVATAPLVAAGFKDLPIREAIDYVHTYLHVTVKAYKFQFGPPVCGGPIEVAFISTDRRFRWVCHKGFDSAIREEEGRSWTNRPLSSPATMSHVPPRP